MRYCLTLFAALTLVIPAYGVVPIPYVSEDQIQLDGQLDDWSEILGPPLLTGSDFLIWRPKQGVFGNPNTFVDHVPLYSEYDPENLDFRIWLGWSTPGRIFVAATFTDDVIRDEGRPLFSKADGLVIAATPDSRESRTYYAIRPAGNIMMPFPYLGGSPVWSVRDPFGHAIRTEQTPTTWGIEFFISCFDVLPKNEHKDENVITDLAAGDEIDLVLQVRDWDADDVQHTGFYLAPEEDASTVRALLLSPGETAVRQQTWGAVKALSETE